MEAGNVKEFVDNLTIQDEMVRYDNHLYYFYAVRYNEDKGKYYISVDQFGNTIYDFQKQICYYEASNISDCIEYLLSEKIWNGKSFWEVEQDMIWVDG